LKNSFFIKVLLYYQAISDLILFAHTPGYNNNQFFPKNKLHFHLGILN